MSEKFDSLLNYSKIGHTVRIAVMLVIAIFSVVTLFVGQAQGFTFEVKDLSSDKDLEAEYTKFMNKVEEKIQKLKTIANRVYLRYLERDSINIDKSFEEVYAGFMEGMDIHSNYLNKEQVVDLDKFFTPHFGGIGVVFRTNDSSRSNEYPEIVSVRDGGPAEKAGVESGDKLISVDGKSMRGVKSDDVAQALRGDVGTTVNIRIEKTKRDNEIVDLRLTRAEYDNETVIHEYIKEENLAYVYIRNFHKETGKQFVKALNEIKEKMPNVKGMILDLRSNAGGSVSAALEVADALLNSGKILISRSLSQEITYNAEPGDLWDNRPLIVLINNRTASSSEILSAALRDNNRAQLLGVRTFGKGVIQDSMTLPDGSRINITTSKFFSPNDKPIQVYGIEPDITVFPKRITKDDLNQDRESDYETRFSEIKNTDDLSDIEKKDLSKAFMRDQQIVIAIDVIKFLLRNSQDNVEKNKIQTELTTSEKSSEN